MRNPELDDTWGLPLRANRYTRTSRLVTAVQCAAGTRVNITVLKRDGRVPGGLKVCLSLSGGGRQGPGRRVRLIGGRGARDPVQSN